MVDTDDHNRFRVEETNKMEQYPSLQPTVLTKEISQTYLFRYI